MAYTHTHTLQTASSISSCSTGLIVEWTSLRPFSYSSGSWYFLFFSFLFFFLFFFLIFSSSRVWISTAIVLLPTHIYVYFLFSLYIFPELSIEGNNSNTKPDFRPLRFPPLREFERNSSAEKKNQPTKTQWIVTINLSREMGSGAIAALKNRINSWRTSQCDGWHRQHQRITLMLLIGYKWRTKANNAKAYASQQMALADNNISRQFPDTASILRF